MLSCVVCQSRVYLYNQLKDVFTFKAVAAHNLSQLRNLNNLARVEMARQEIRSKLEEADSEVKTVYLFYQPEIFSESIIKLI